MSSLSFLTSFSGPASLDLIRLPTDQQPNNQPKQPQHTTEDLNHQHLHKQRRVCRIRQRRTTSVDAHTDTADQITHPDRDACPEQRIAREHVRRSVEPVFRHERANLSGEDDRHDDTVDGDDFAEDDGDEVLGSYPWGAHAAAEDGCAGDEDAPVKLCLSACSVV
jgi:hypothetical protein